MNSKQKLIFSLAVVVGLAAAAVWADPDCAKTLEGSWTFVPNPADASQVQALADLGVIEVAFNASASTWTTTLGTEQAVVKASIGDCTGTGLTLAQEDTTEKLIIAFVDADTISVTSTKTDESGTPQVFKRKKK